MSMPWIPREAAGQEATAQERAELGFDEARKALTVAQARGFGEEALDMLSHHRIHDGGSRVARRVLEDTHAPTGADYAPVAGTGRGAAHLRLPQACRGKWQERFELHHNWCLNPRNTPHGLLTLRLVFEATCRPLIGNPSPQAHSG
jgi:hypothetical protein